MLDNNKIILLFPCPSFLFALLAAVAFCFLSVCQFLCLFSTQRSQVVQVYRWYRSKTNILIPQQPNECDAVFDSYRCADLLSNCSICLLSFPRPEAGQFYMMFPYVASFEVLFSEMCFSKHIKSSRITIKV